MYGRGKLTISFTFLVTTLPLTVVSIAAAFVSRTAGPDALTASRFELARTIAELLMYANHAINFYLYCATGQKFRRQLIWTVCYSRRTYWLPGDAERRSPAPSAAGPGMGRLPSDSVSRHATGARLAMRAGDAVVLRRMVNCAANRANSGAGPASSGHSAGSGGGSGVSGGQQQASGGGATPRSQLHLVVVDTICMPGNVSLDNPDHRRSGCNVTTAPYTDNSVL